MSTPSEDPLYFTVDGVSKADLEQAGRMKVTVNETEIALFCEKGQFYAIQAKCPHYGGPLHEAAIEELPDKSLCVKCPWHKWKFSLDSGKCLFPSHHESKTAMVYPVKVENEKMSIGFKEIAPVLFTKPPNF